MRKKIHSMISSSAGFNAEERKPWYLEQANFYDNLTDEQKIAVDNMGVRKRFKKGELICNLDDPCNYIYILKKGAAKVFLLTADGREIMLAIRLPGNIIGMTAIFGWGRRVSYVSALEDVELLAIKVTELNKFIMNNINVAILIINILGARLHHSRMIIEDLSSKNVQERLIRFILNLASQIGKKSKDGLVINLALTHEQIGQMIASSRQTVTLMINDLEYRGWIKKTRNRIIILDKAAMEKMIG